MANSPAAVAAATVVASIIPPDYRPRVLIDNGVGYRSRLFEIALADTGVRHQRTRPYQPQSNGKVEQFNRTLSEEWAYRRQYAWAPNPTARHRPII